MRRPSVDTLLDRAAAVANLGRLRTNDLPNCCQVEVNNYLASLLESELASLPLDDIRTRTRIHAQLAINRSIAAPIRRLPRELLGEIFTRSARKSPLRTLHVAATLAGVCTVWRVVACGLPKLWTKVIVKSVRAFDGYCESFLPLVKAERSILRCDAGEALGRLWDRVEPYASCWRSITLEGRLGILPDLRVIYMENLERLVVNAYGAPASPDLSVLDFVVAPRLRHIALTIDALQSDRQLQIPVTRMLTSLEIDVMSPFSVLLTLPLLRACADTLQSLILKVRYPLDGTEGSYPTSTSDTFAMKALHLLSLCSPACALLNHITAPVVNELILSNVPEYGTHSLPGFLTRSQASRHLQILRVYQAVEKEVSAWMPCIWLMDDLRELHFDELLSSEEFLRLLAHRADERRILPSLAHIAICHIFWNHPELHDVIGDVCAARERERVVNGEVIYIGIGWIEE